MRKEFQRIATVGRHSGGQSSSRPRFGWRARLPARLSGAFVVLAEPFAERFETLGEPLFEAIWSLSGETITSSRTSRVERICWPGSEQSPTPASADGGCYLKRYWYPRRRERLRAGLRNTFLGPSRCAREWHHLRALNQRGLSPLRPVATGESRHLGFLLRSFIITEEIPGGQTACLALRQGSAADRLEILAGLGAWVGRLHRTGFAHGGLRLRNIIVLPDGRFAAIDPPRATWHRTTIHLRRPARRDLWTIAEDLCGAVSATEADRARQAYLGNSLSEPARARLRRAWPLGAKP